MVILGSLNEEVKEISLQDLTFANKKKEEAQEEARAFQNVKWWLWIIIKTRILSSPTGIKV